MKFILLINIKMKTGVSILSFVSKINILLSWFEHEKRFRTSGTGGSPRDFLWSIWNREYFSIHVHETNFVVLISMYLWPYRSFQKTFKKASFKKKKKNYQSKIVSPGAVFSQPNRKESVEHTHPVTNQGTVWVKKVRGSMAISSLAQDLEM